jgi:hypothetical protein
MIKKRYDNPEIQKWYEKYIKMLMKDKEEYKGLSEEEVDEMVKELKFISRSEAEQKQIIPKEMN